MWLTRTQCEPCVSAHHSPYVSQKKDDGESESAANAQRSDSVVKCDAVARGVNIESVKRRLCAREGALELLGFVARAGSDSFFFSDF